MSLTVRGTKVLVETEDQSVTEQPSGIVTVESYAPEVVGRVVAMGVDVGKVSEVEVGDVVFFSPEAGMPLDFQTKRYLVMDESELLGIWEPEGNA